jgi:ABC-type phosphate transport system substrate-binding protein
MTLALIMGATIVAANATADVVVIVSASSNVTRLTAEQATKIFLGKVYNVPHDGNVFPIDQPEGSSAREEFYTKVANKNAAQLTAYWAKVIFTGDGNPPKLLESDEEVKMAVAKNPSAIGYIDKTAVDSSVRVILAP